MMNLRWIITLAFLGGLPNRFTAEDEECKDDITFCGNLDVYCNDEDHLYHPFTVQNCKATCKLCPKDIDPSGLCKNNGNCEQLCNVEEQTRRVCSCYQGYRLKNDGEKCEDINECDIGDVCGALLPGGEHKVCRNLRGSHSCYEVLCQDAGTEPYADGLGCCTKEPASSPCGSPRTRMTEERIVGGKDAKIGQWPWQVLIVLNKTIICGGSILSDKWVITAGHCFREETPERPLFANLFFGIRRLQEQDRTMGRLQKRSLKRRILYPRWNRRKFEINDIALIELDRSITFNNFVQPICLPNGEKPNVGKKCFASGWGLTDEENQQPSDILQYVDLPVVDPVECKEAYKDEDTKVNNEIMFCAGYKEGGKDACTGDSGGPLVCQRCDSCGWYLAGVVSFGSGCANAGFYGVYANVYHYEEWISNHTGIPITQDKSCTGPYLTQWSQWDACSVSCGPDGQRSRKRRCMHKGKDSDDCQGRLRESESCPVKKCPEFGKFGEWSKCSVTCGGGVRTQIRECLHGAIGDDGCPRQEANRQGACNEQECPSWGKWSDWSSCSTTCGQGSEERKRECINGD